MIYVTGCSSPLAMERYKDSFVLSAARGLAWTRAMAVTDGRVSPSKTTSGQIRAASYPHSTARQRTFTVQVFVVSLRMKWNHGSYFFGR